MMIPLGINRHRRVTLLHLFHSRIHIHSTRLMRPRILPINNPMHKVNHQEQWNPNIRRHKTTDTPVLRPEDSEAVDECQEGEKSNGEVGTVGLEEGVVGEAGGGGDVLREAGFVEAEVDDAAADPGDEAGCVR